MVYRKQSSILFSRSKSEACSPWRSTLRSNFESIPVDIPIPYLRTMLPIK